MYPGAVCLATVRGTINLVPRMGEQAEHLSDIHSPAVDVPRGEELAAGLVCKAQLLRPACREESPRLLLVEAADDYARYKRALA